MIEIDCEKPMKLETSPKVTKSKRSLHWCRSISKKISVQVLLQYQSKSYYIIGQEVYYSIGHFITLSGSYYIIGRFLLDLYIIGQLLQSVSGVYYIIGWYTLLSFLMNMSFSSGKPTRLIRPCLLPRSDHSERIQAHCIQ